MRQCSEQDSHEHQLTAIPKKTEIRFLRKSGPSHGVSQRLSGEEVSPQSLKASVRQSRDGRLQQLSHWKKQEVFGRVAFKLPPMSRFKNSIIYGYDHVSGSISVMMLIPASWGSFLKPKIEALTSNLYIIIGELFKKLSEILSSLFWLGLRALNPRTWVIDRTWWSCNPHPHALQR